jgi:hypothetical protein
MSGIIKGLHGFSRDFLKGLSRIYEVFKRFI